MSSRRDTAALDVRAPAVERRRGRFRARHYIDMHKALMIPVTLILIATRLPGPAAKHDEHERGHHEREAQQDLRPGEYSRARTRACAARSSPARAGAPLSPIACIVAPSRPGVRLPLRTILALSCARGAGGNAGAVNGSGEAVGTRAKGQLRASLPLVHKSGS